MAMRRSSFRLAVATSVLFAVIVTLTVIIVHGPTKFFEARSVQSDATCTVRHCLATEDQPGRQVQQQLRQQ